MEGRVGLWTGEGGAMAGEGGANLQSLNGFTNHGAHDTCILAIGMRSRVSYPGFPKELEKVRSEFRT